ncbi:uncharacterized protein [Clytia hemisphaerica]|uniref:Uncharacterized protein n=3 Tax=Clytia hemisphaerica TaxID=252671 RepID=A0A7M5XM85_9CNID
MIWCFVIVAIFQFMNGIDTLWQIIEPEKQLDLGPYDSISVYNGTTFIISGKPCKTGKSLALTILKIEQNIFIHFDDVSTNPKPINIDNGFGVVMTINQRTDHSDHLYRINIKPVVLNTTTHQVIDYLPGSLLEVHWMMDKAKCKRHIASSSDDLRNDPGFIKADQCTKSMRHGDFSTMCYKKSEALYMTVLNICDIPYSVKVISMLDSKEASIHTFTSEKFDEDLQITHGLLGSHCGLRVTQFHSHMKNHEKQHIQVQHVCKSIHAGRNYTVIDDSYFTIYGMLCPLSDCKTLNATNRRICKQKMFNEKGKMSEAVITTKLEVCEKTKIRAKVDMSVEGYPKNFSKMMEAMVDLFDNSKRESLHLGGTHPSLHLGNGFMQIDGGEVSLYVSADHHDNSHKFHVMLLRHFPHVEDRFPLIHDDVIIDEPDKPCSGVQPHKRSKTGVQPWLLIVLVLFGILLIVAVAIFLKWWRSRQHNYSNADIGLPYHIELDDDDFTIDQFDQE